MNKELTPLEALEIIKNAPTIYVGCASDVYTRYSFECNIIEKTLKAYGYFEDNSKKLKALEIIKEKIFAGLYRTGFALYTRGGAVVKILTQEEYDLLKEVL